MRSYSTVFLALCLAATAASHERINRIVGGEVTTIDRYPFATSILFSNNLVTYSQICGGTILTSNAILTAAHCIISNLAVQFRIRAGSTFANSGGTVHGISQNVIHPNYDGYVSDPDLAIMRTSSAIVYDANTGPARIAGPIYVLPDHTPIVAIGWGRTSFGGLPSEQLREVTILTVNHEICKARYAFLASTVPYHIPDVTDGMLCSGWLDVGGRDACQGDSGGPVIHGDDVIVGVTSWGEECALASYPGVNANVAYYSTWIQTNAIA